MELIELGALSLAVRAELEGDEPDPWGTTGSELTWRPKDHHVALRMPDGRLAATAGWLIADLKVGDQLLPVVGIGGVIVPRAHRGQGLGRRVIAELLARAQELGPEIAILFCQPEKVGLYQRRGFVPIVEPVHVQQPTGLTEMPLPTMWRALRDGSGLPAGPVRLPGPPF